jgi:hypothetical protein
LPDSFQNEPGPVAQLFQLGRLLPHVRLADAGQFISLGGEDHGFRFAHLDELFSGLKHSAKNLAD